MGVVNDLEVTKLKLCYILDFSVQFKDWERVWCSFQLLHQGFNVIRVYVSVTKYMNELTTF